MKKLVSSLLIAGSLITAVTVVSAHSSHEGNEGLDLSRSSDLPLSKNVKNQLKDVKAATEKYKDFRVAEEDGFINTHEFAFDPELGGMGIHFVKPNRMVDNDLNITEPEVLLYQPIKDGDYKLIGVEYYVPAALSDSTPVLFEHEFDGPMLNHELDPTTLSEVEKNDRNNQHYDLHVWVWKNNPNGLFTPFNPNVENKTN